MYCRNYLFLSTNDHLGRMSECPYIESEDELVIKEIVISELVFQPPNHEKRESNC